MPERILKKPNFRHLYLRITVPFMKRRPGPKVFCIGYNKTGTTSLGASFKLLGYKNSSFNRTVWRKYYQRNQIEKVLQYTHKFDSFDDLPWLKEDMIPILDKEFPHSKFVYLVREEESWKKSYYTWAYNVCGIYPDIDKAWEGYKKHEKFVLDYFKDRSSEDFISLDILDNNGFRKLADFLGKETNLTSFPHLNKTMYLP